MRFYAENSEYPRVIDRRNGKCVWTAPAYGYDQATYTADAMNRIWERDVEFVAEWLATNASVTEAVWWGEEMGARHE